MSTSSRSTYSILPKTIPLTPYQMYLYQVKGTIDSIRYSAQGLDYIPPQFGGIFGQRQALEEQVSLENVEFKVS